jgi:predicted Rossmann fold flavoprotein
VSIVTLPSSCDVAVIGGGAAGLATAIFAKRDAPALSILLLEGARKPGAKILISGGSRCNVTNAVVSEADFSGGSRAIVRRVLRRLTSDHTIAFFEDLGVPLHVEPNGKLFPDSNRSRDVLDALLRELSRVGVPLMSDHRVTGVHRDATGFRVNTRLGCVTAKHLVLATGGLSLPKTGSDGFGFMVAKSFGHSIVSTTPALVPLVLEDTPSAIHGQLTGVSHEAEIALWIQGRIAVRIRGEMLWTHFGVSGPAALDASRHWARAALDGTLPATTLNFLPGRTFDDVERWLIGEAASRGTALVRTALGSVLPAAIGPVLMKALGFDPDVTLAQLARAARRRSSGALTAWPLPVVDTRGYNYAEVTAGGVSLTEIDPSTMESRLCPGLFLVGEALDVDGRLGGFNFQWAWSSARVAGAALAARAEGARAAP